MPELPDVVVYIDCLEQRILGAKLESVRIGSPFVLRSVEPPPAAIEGKHVQSIRRIGKRIAIGFESDLFAVLHLMIAGRLRWRDKRQPVPKRGGLVAFDFSTGTLLFTEAGTKRRASLALVHGEAGVDKFDRGGLEVLEAGLDDFRVSLTRENHTLKRALTDPRLFSGIGNAYSDEILHAARLSPLKHTQKLTADEIATLYKQTQRVLRLWINRLRSEVGSGFPEKVTAFRDGMAAHGRFRHPCPDCGAPIQRIRYAENEVNYCAKCQTSGKLLADRALSRLLKGDWPRTLEEWENPRER